MLEKDRQRAFVSHVARGIVTAVVTLPALKNITNNTSMTKRIVESVTCLKIF